MWIFDELGIDLGYVVIGLIGFIILLTIIVLVLLVKSTKLKKSYKAFMMGNQGSALEEIMMSRFQEIDELKKAKGVIDHNIKNLTDNMTYTFQKVGLVKYDAFREMGGKLSFALALLNGENSGIIINSMHSSREGCYTYVKEIIHGESYVMLADEEKEALNSAIKSRVYME